MTKETTSETPGWIAWSPGWAPDVRGMYTPRTFDDDHMPEPQTVRARCTHCGDTFEAMCLSGMVRKHITNFAILHVHRDPLGASRVQRPKPARTE